MLVPDTIYKVQKYVKVDNKLVQREIEEMITESGDYIYYAIIIFNTPKGQVRVAKQIDTVTTIENAFLYYDQAVELAKKDMMKPKIIT